MWRKLFRKRKGQAVMIFVVITLCVTLVNGALTTLLSMNGPCEELKEECHAADVSVYASEEEKIRKKMKEDFESLDEVENVEVVTYSYVSEDMYAGNTKIDAYLDLALYNPAVYANVRYVEGNRDALEHLGQNECFIPAYMQNEYHLAVGDEIVIQLGGGDYTYRIKGIFAESYSVSSAFDSVVLVGKIPSEMKMREMFRIYAADGYDADDIEEAYKKISGGLCAGYLNKISDVLTNTYLATDLTSAIFLVIGVMMLAVSCMILNFMVRHTMHTDAKTIAIYKTIGYSTGDIMRMYLAFYFSIIFVAACLGVWLSQLPVSIIIGSAFANIGEVVSVNVLYTGIYCVLVTILLVFITVWCVVRRTKKVRPVYALNGLENTNSRKLYKGKLNVGFSPMWIAVRNIMRDKKGCVGMLVIATTSLFVINFGMVSLDVAWEQKNHNEYWVGIDASDVYADYTTQETRDEVADYLEQDERVDHYVLGATDPVVYLDWDKYSCSNVITANIFDDYSNMEMSVTQGRNPRSFDEVALSAKVAEDMGKSVGDYMEMYLEDGTRVKLLITGLFQTYHQMGNVCRMVSDTFENANKTVKYDTATIYLKENTDEEAFIGDMKKAFGNTAVVRPRTEKFSAVLNMITNPQKQGIPAAIVLVFAIGGVNIFCIVMLKNAENRRNNEIYKSIGYSSGDLICANLYYVGIIAMISMLIAVPLLVGSYGSIMSMAVGMFGFKEYPYDLNVWHLIWINVATVAVFMLGSVLTGRSMARLDVRNLVVE